MKIETLIELVANLSTDEKSGADIQMEVLALFDLYLNDNKPDTPTQFLPYDGSGYKGDYVPYHVICGCSVCNCVMGNKMVPKNFSNRNNYTGQTSNGVKYDHKSTTTT